MLRVRATYIAWDQLEERLGREEINYNQNRNVTEVDWRPQGKKGCLQKTCGLLPFVCLALFVFLLSGTEVEAQTGMISGTVVDSSGAAIPRAHVQVINQATGAVTRDATTDSAGTFRALNIPPTTYNIKVTSPECRHLNEMGLCWIRNRVSI